MQEIIIFTLSFVIGFLGTQLWRSSRKINKLEKFYYLAFQEMPPSKQKQLMNKFYETK